MVILDLFNFSGLFFSGRVDFQPLLGALVPLGDLMLDRPCWMKTTSGESCWPRRLVWGILVEYLEDHPT